MSDETNNGPENVSDSQQLPIPTLSKAAMRRNPRIYLRAIQQGKMLVIRKDLEAIIKQLFNIEADELSSMFPKDRELFEYYANVLCAADKIPGECQEDAPVDNYKLSRSEKTLLADVELAAKRRDREKALRRERLEKEAQSMFPDAAIDELVKKGSRLIRKKS